MPNLSPEASLDEQNLSNLLIFIINCIMAASADQPPKTYSIKERTFTAEFNLANGAKAQTENLALAVRQLFFEGEELRLVIRRAKDTALTITFKQSYACSTAV